MLETTLAALAAFPQQLEAHFQAFPPDGIRWKPASWEGIPSESLSALEQICHVRDIEIDGYLRRFQCMLSETNPVLESLDTYALVEARNYDSADPAEVFAAIRAARLETVTLLAQLNESQLRREGYFEGYGQVTLKGLIHYLCSHDQQHLAGLQWLLGQMASPAR